MGRNNPSNFKVHANQQGGRRVYNDHDDRVGGQISYGNRTWRKDGSGSSGGGPKHVSFKSSGGGVRGRLGPPKKNRGGINLRNVGFDEDDDGDMSSQGSSRGVFRERTLRELPLRHFNRMFVVVPQGSGFCIVNEMLHVTLPTAKQADAAFTTAQASSVPPAAAQLDANTKNLRIQEFSQKTGMNVKYCMECMGPNEYDLEKSFVAFQAAQQAGKIPIEAFEK